MLFTLANGGHARAQWSAFCALDDYGALAERSRPQRSVLPRLDGRPDPSRGPTPLPARAPARTASLRPSGDPCRAQRPQEPQPGQRRRTPARPSLATLAKPDAAPNDRARRFARVLETLQHPPGTRARSPQPSWPTPRPLPCFRAGPPRAAVRVAGAGWRSEDAVLESLRAGRGRTPSYGDEPRVRREKEQRARARSGRSRLALAHARSQRSLWTWSACWDLECATLVCAVPSNQLCRANRWCCRPPSAPFDAPTRAALPRSTRRAAGRAGIWGTGRVSPWQRRPEGVSSARGGTFPQPPRLSSLSLAASRSAAQKSARSSHPSTSFRTPMVSLASSAPFSPRRIRSSRALFPRCGWFVEPGAHEDSRALFKLAQLNKHQLPRSSGRKGVSSRGTWTRRLVDPGQRPLSSHSGSTACTASSPLRQMLLRKNRPFERGLQLGQPQADFLPSHPRANLSRQPALARR